ncbi:hypothetical protein A5798_001101, partial [Enterococcus sp. 6C8_DIV0013]
IQVLVRLIKIIKNLINYYKN